MMEARIRITDGISEDLAALGAWLQQEDELRGRIRIVPSGISETELGAISDVLIAALSTGGAGTVLASSLRTWLLTRRTTAKITVEASGRTVTLDIQTVGDAAPLLEQILNATDKR